MLRVFTFLILLVIVRGTALAQVDKTHWVDSIMSTLSVDEKIGQLFMLVVPSRATPDQIDAAHDDVKSLDLGGVVFQQESPGHQVQVANVLRDAARIPLFVAQDGEWGVSQSVDSTIQFPRPLILGAVANDSLIYQMGRETAKHMKLLGVNLSFASLADVNSTKQDRPISYRSFGSNPENVANKIASFVRGMQDIGVLTCAKQFSITGLTVTNYTNEIPRVRATVDTTLAYPYKKLFQNNVAGVMPASSSVPLYYDKVKPQKTGLDPASMAHLFTGQWLKEQQGFKGLSFVDLQQVKIATDKNREGDEAVLAFQAGNDVLVGAADIGASIRKLRRLVKADESYEAQLETTVRKILQAKFDAGLSHKQRLNPDNLLARLNSPTGQVITEQLYEQAVTVIKNGHSVLPITQLDNKQIAYVTSDARDLNEAFYGSLSKYAHASHYTLDEKTDLVKLTSALAGHQILIIGVFPQTTAAVLERIERTVSLLKPNVEVIYCDFGNELFMRTVEKHHTSLTAYCNSLQAMSATSEVLFGAIPATGRLPFAVSRGLTAGAGVNTKSLQRLRYATPESARMDSRMMSRIDSIAREAIATGATPGMQVIVARGGTVVYEKNFGTLNHNKNNPVTSETIYDLASLTKVSATLQAVMFMQERGLIDINRKVSFYLPELKKSNKKDITIIEMLTHQAGLAPFIPMWPETMKDTTFLPLYYSRTRSTAYPLQVSSNLYGSMALRDSVWSWIVNSKLIEKVARTPYAYKYSDLGFLILQRLAEKLLNQPIDEFVAQNVYEPLGAYTAGFMPLDRFPLQQIAPTEYDRIFRKTLVAGTVHDERGALMGGVAGHAGLFGTATDLTKLGQMLLQEGYYGGYRYYKPETVRLFTNKQFDKSRRGLGWDKPVQSDWNSPTSLKASPRTFGHTGFTGTCLWVDPEFDLVYVFLSNRVYPDRSGKLISSNIRSRIQDVIYDAIFTYCDDYPASPTTLQNAVVSSRR